MFGLKLICGIVLLAMTATVKIANAASWYPVQVYEWVPAFNTESKRALKSYMPIDGAAQKKWRICVSIPHLKDAYWLGVNYGLVEEAETRGIVISIYEAGGYEKQQIQIQQIEKCIANGIDALIVSTISLDGANDALAKANAKGIPVIDMINGTSYHGLSARAAADFYDNGFATGKYLAKLHEKSTLPISVLWFPGPKEAGWSQRADLGFRDAIKGSKITILATGYGDTGKRTQSDLIEKSLTDHPDADYIVGTAVTAEAAIPIVQRKNLANRTNILAYYFSPGVYRGITRGSILAAPSDLQAIQARIAVDQAIRILENRPFMKHIGPKIEVIDKSNLAKFDLTTSLAPRGFKAIFDVD